MHADNMRETLADFLRGMTEYRIVGDYLVRPDKTIAAEFTNGKVLAYPTREEIILFNLYSGRGFPGRMCERDLTNPGHI